MADGLVVPGTIDPTKRVKVNNPDGTFSTLESMSINSDGVEWLIPTLRPDGSRMSPQQAVQWFRQTGQHLGGFASPAQADAYAKSLSKLQGQRYAPPRGLLD